MQARRRVSLHNDVTVIPVPTRADYPPPVRAQLWNSAAELHFNAMRNAVEFAAEGFEWRRAVEETGMVELPHGEKVHPVHFANMAAPHEDLTSGSRGGRASPSGRPQSFLQS